MSPPLAEAAAAAVLLLPVSIKQEGDGEMCGVGKRWLLPDGRRFAADVSVKSAVREGRCEAAAAVALMSTDTLSDCLLLSSRKAVLNEVGR